jgi:hypothetical protein
MAVEAGWIFRELRDDEPRRNPTEGRFIRRDPAAVIIREAIQNSLDAARPNEKVRVRVCVTEIPDSPDVQWFFRGLQEHAGAAGLSWPSGGRRIRCLVIEDFGTTGLTGGFSRRDRNGHFYQFWWNVGRSEKAEGRRGRWGVGKSVFHLASEIGCFFGLTVRDQQPRALLMGRSVTRIHELDGREWDAYATFGRKETPEDCFVLPVCDLTVIKGFQALFQLERRDEPGLSVVVPYLVDDVQFGELRTAVIKEYFFAILNATLSVKLYDGRTEVTLDDSSIADEVAHLEDVQSRATGAFLQLAQWGLENETSAQPLLFSSLDRAPKWDAVPLTDSQLAALQQQFADRKPVAFSVRLPVQPRGRVPEKGVFYVYLQRVPDLGGVRPMFIRRDLNIVKAAENFSLRDAVALVYIPDGPLANLLALSEDHGHSEWQERSEEFRNRYVYGRDTIRFVRNSVRELYERLSPRAGQTDRQALIDVFYLPLSAQPSEPAKPGNTAGDGRRTPGSGKGPPVKQPLRLEKINGGFTVSPAQGASLAGRTIRVLAGYAVRGGSGIARYDPLDFDFSSDGFDIGCTGATVTHRRENRLEILVLQNSFRVSVAGFDGNRDLEVDAEVLEGSDEAKV